MELEQYSKEEIPAKKAERKEKNFIMFRYWSLHILHGPIILAMIGLFLLYIILFLVAIWFSAVREEYAIYKGETKLFIVEGSLTFLQHRLTIQSEGSTISVFKLPEIPPICPIFADEVTTAAIITERQRSHLEVYMLEKSLFRVTLGLDAQVNFFVVVGQDNYLKLLETGGSNPNHDFIVYSSLMASNLTTNYFLANSTGTYYFVVFANETTTVGGRYAIDVRRSTYCTASATTRITNQTYVDLNINILGSTIILVKNEGIPYYVPNVPVTVKFQSEKEFYGFFYGTPFMAIWFTLCSIVAFVILFFVKGRVLFLISRVFYATGIDKKFSFIAFLGRFMQLDRYWEIKNRLSRMKRAEAPVDAKPVALEMLDDEERADNAGAEKQSLNKHEESSESSGSDASYSSSSGSEEESDSEAAIVHKVEKEPMVPMEPMEPMEPVEREGPPEYSSVDDPSTYYMPSMDLYSAQPTYVTEYPE